MYMETDKENKPTQIRLLLQQVKTTLPCLIPSPDKKGGGRGVGLATLPRQKLLCCGTDRERDSFSSLAVALCASGHREDCSERNWKMKTETDRKENGRERLREWQADLHHTDRTGLD